MTRSIEQIATGKTTQELRKEAVALLRKTKIPFVQQGIERTPGYIQSNGRKQACIEYISLCETTLASAKKPTVETSIESSVETPIATTKPTQVKKTPKTPKNTKKQPVAVVETTPQPTPQITEVTAEPTTPKEEPSDYSDSEAQKLGIAKKLYYATAAKDDLTGLREYQLHLCKTQKYFLPEFAILVARSRVIIEDYANAKSPEGKAHPGTIQKIRVDIMRYLADIVKPEVDKFPAVNDRTLKDIFEEFEASVRGAFSDIGKAKYQLNQKKNLAAEDDVRAIKVSPFIEWAVSQVSELPDSPARWREIAIALMLLTGRRQSEVMSSGVFTFVDESHVIFEGQLKRHVAELVEAEKIPVLGKSARAVVNAIHWLENHGKRTIPTQRTPEALQAAAKKSHDRCSRYIAEAMDKLSVYCQIVNNKQWELVDNGKVVNKFKGHLCRQIYAQVCSGLFHDDNESKKRAYISRILLENRDAALIYDRDIEVKDWQELKQLCGKLTDN